MFAGLRVGALTACGASGVKIDDLTCNAAERLIRVPVPRPCGSGDLAYVPGASDDQLARGIVMCHKGGLFAVGPGYHQ